MKIENTNLPGAYREAPPDRDREGRVCAPAHRAAARAPTPCNLFLKQHTWGNYFYFYNTESSRTKKKHQPGKPSLSIITPSLLGGGMKHRHEHRPPNFFPRI